MISRLKSALALLALCLTTPLAAQDNTEVPYWASIRAEEVNMRVGPGEDYHISWVFHRRHLPLKVLRLKEGWRLVQDPDGARGWMLARFLMRERGGYVQGQGLADMRAEPSDSAKLLWRLKTGVTGKLGDCADGWCHLELDGRAGYVRQDRLWGAGEP